MSESNELIHNGWATTIWIDPGGTTGWSVFSVHPDALVDPDISVLENVGHWQQGQVSGDENAQITELVQLASMWPDAALGIENFKLRTRRSSEDTLSPVRITAAYRWAVNTGHNCARGCGKERGRRLFSQMPSYAMTEATDERLRLWGFYVREGGEEHARDATRHSLAFLKKCSSPSGARLRGAAWPHLFTPTGERHA